MPSGKANNLYGRHCSTLPQSFQSLTNLDKRQQHQPIMCSGHFDVEVSLGFAFRPQFPLISRFISLLGAGTVVAA